MSNTRSRSARWLALALLIMCLLLPSIAFAAPKVASGTIKGTVVGYDDIRLKNVSVVAYEMTGTPGQTEYYAEEIARTTTGNNGSYTLKLAPGTYRVGFYSASPETYAWEYYPGVPSLPGAEDITVVARGTVRGIDARLESAGRISGTVVDADGNALSGIEVTLRQQWPGRPEQVMSMTTGSEGTFDFRGLPVDGFGVWATDPSGWLLATSAWMALDTPGEQISGVVLEMTGAGKIAGTVVDESGDPAAGVEVVPYLWIDDGEGGWWEASYDLFDETAADGTYELGGLMPGTVAVRFSDEDGRYAQEFYSDAVAPGLADPVTVVAGTVHGGIDATLTAGGSISGNVTTPDGPFTGWGVFFSAWVDDHWEDVGGAACDEAGHYSARLPVGSYRVYFDVQDWSYVPEFWENSRSPESATPVDVTAENLDVTGIDALLALPSHITGRVTDEVTGDPIANITVGAGVQMGTDWWGHVSWGYTDENGYYDMPVGVGTYRVQFWDDGGTYVGEGYDNVVGQTDPGAGDDVTVAEEGQVVSGIDAALALAGHIRGRVTNSDGEPVAGFGVAGGLEPDYYQHVAWADTDDEGYYDLAVPAGTYRVNFQDWNGLGYLAEWYDNVIDPDQAQSIPVSAGGEVTGIDAVLETPALIRGRVTDGGGTGLADIRVEGHQVVPGSNDYPPYLSETQTDADGFYELAVSAGTDVIVQFQDWANNTYLAEWYDDVSDWQDATTLSATVETPKESVDAVLVMGAHISGRVTDAGGDGIADIDVSAETTLADPQQGTRWAGSSGTDEEGYYDMLVAPGVYLIHFGDYQNNVYLNEWYDDAGQNWQDATPVVTSLAEPAQGVGAVLAEGAHIFGHVTDTDGVPIAGIGVAASLRPAEGETMQGGVGGAETNENGDYDIVLPAGDYIVNFGPWNNPGYLSEWFDDVMTWSDATTVTATVATPATGVDAALADASLIQGRVTDSAGGGIGGVDVGIVVPGSEWWMLIFVGGAETDSDGYYSAPIPAGTYYVQFSASDAPATWAAEWYNDQLVGQLGTPVIVAEGATVGGVDAVLSAPGTISGRVTDAGGNPVAGLQVVNAVEADTGQWPWFNQTVTNGNGEYTLYCHPGEVLVGFVDTSNYWAEQWYPNSSGPGGGTLQTVTSGGSLTGRDAVMMPRVP